MSKVRTRSTVFRVALLALVAALILAPSALAKSRHKHRGHHGSPVTITKDPTHRPGPSWYPGPARSATDSGTGERQDTRGRGTGSAVAGYRGAIASSVSGRPSNEIPVSLRIVAAANGFRAR